MLVTQVSASILSADPLEFGREIKRVEKSGAEMIHYDVMDGIFVNNITFGMPLLKSMKGKTECILDVHLMIQEPLKYIDDFADAGADIITFHIEATENVTETIEKIKSVRLLPVSTVAGNGIVYAFKVDKVTVISDNEQYSVNALIGVMEKSRQEYDAIFNPKILI